MSVPKLGKEKKAPKLSTGPNQTEGTGGPKSKKNSLPAIRKVGVCKFFEFS
jgi:hypothetical protein